MMTDTTTPNIPRLRFQNDNEQSFADWEKVKLGELGNFKSGVGFPEVEQGGSEGTPLYKVSDMNLLGNETHMQHANNYVSDQQIERLRFKPIKEQAVIFAKVGAAIFLERKRLAQNFLIDNNMMAFVPNERIALQYLPHVFSTIRLSKLAQVGALPSYNGSDLSTIRLFVPEIEEQRKIASFLTSVDTKIQQIEKKKTLWEQYKKGCMQQIFSQQIRFKADDGSDFPDWEDRRLGEVADIYQPETLSQSQLDPSGEYLVYGANGVIGRLNRYNHDKAQVTITCRGNTCGSVSFTKPKSWITGNSMVINLDNSPDASKAFFYNLLVYTDWTYLITGSGQPQITGDIKKHKFRLAHFDEQQKIADFLTAIDTKIDLISQEISHAKAFKKGLLQQMFV